MHTEVVFVLVVFLLLGVYSRKSFFDLAAEYSDNELNSSRNNRSGNGRIASCAVLSKGSTFNHTYEPIVFDVVHQNYGNGYNNKTGKFTVPKTGTYRLWFDTYNGKKRSRLYMAINRFINRNTTQMFGIRRRNRRGHRRNSAMSIYLDKGDHVWMASNRDKIADAPTGIAPLSFCAIAK